MDDFTAELVDRYGPLPDEAANLLVSLELKLRASRAGLRRIRVSPRTATVELEWPEGVVRQFGLLRDPLLPETCHLDVVSQRPFRVRVRADALAAAVGGGARHPGGRGGDPGAGRTGRGWGPRRDRTSRGFTLTDCEDLSEDPSKKEDPLSGARDLEIQREPLPALHGPGRVRGLVLLAVCLVAAAGCKKASNPKADAEKPVAFVAADTVKVDDVAKYMQAAGLNRTIASRDSAIEDLIAVQLVKVAAKRQPLTPEQEAQKKDWESQLTLSQFRDSVMARDHHHSR